MGRADRFWAKVDRSGRCWVWLGSRFPDGYGQFGRYRNGRSARAHRTAWELTNGPIPAGLQVLHHCDNPPCVRPDHLFLGTIRDNSDDKIAKGRHEHGSGHHSVRHPFALVEQARALRADGLTYPAIGKALGVSRWTARGWAAGIDRRYGS